MNAIDKRIQELYQFEPDRTLSTTAIDSFWEGVLAQYKTKPLNDQCIQVETPMQGIEVYDVSYEGFDDTPIRAWYMVPAHLKLAEYPCLIFFHGYTGERGLPEQYASWLLAGFAVLAVDVRGQGDTGNRLADDHGIMRGWLTQNITDKQRCYYMAITIDAWKAVDWAMTRAEIDSKKIAVIGGSQGGGLSLITSALHSGVSYCVADIPNMCHMDFGILNSTSSLTEAAAFVKRYPDLLEPVLETLAHFDMMNLAHRIHIPVRISVGLKDTVCMPETIFAVYNRLATEKVLDIHPFSGHEVSSRQTRRHMTELIAWISKD